MIFYSFFYLKFIFYSLSPQPPLKKFWIRTCNYLKTKIYSYIFVSLFSSFFHWQYLYKIKSNFNIKDIILFLTWPWADQGFFTMDIKITKHCISSPPLHIQHQGTHVLIRDISRKMCCHYALHAVVVLLFNYTWQWQFCRLPNYIMRIQSYR